MELALAFPYALGVVAAFNPCGFAMLPAYLSYFVGTEAAEGEANLLRNVIRGILVGLTLTAGFVIVFGVFGLLFETVLSVGTITSKTGYFTVAVGVGMVPLGIYMLLGRELNLHLPKMNKGTDGRQLSSVLMFGVSYAVVSLSCTIGLFLAGVSGSFARQGFADGVANFLAYGVGMGSVITFLTISLAMARTNIARDMRRVLPYVSRISGGMLVLAGVYLVNYGIWEIRVLDDPTVENAAVNWFENVQANVQNWINDTTPQRLGVLSLLAVGGALLVGWREVTPDPVKRRSLTLTYLLAYMVVELGFNRGDFLLGPVARFVVGWPERVANWVTDPLRFGVIGEILFLALVARWIYRRTRRALHPRSRERAPAAI
ncbi:MAG: cytochrome c biogenesis CcdA family protein [Acidimicrobiales bacterium]